MATPQSLPLADLQRLHARTQITRHICEEGWSAIDPQTILAYGMNGRSLPVPYGAPLRLRVERQMGYKSMK